MIDNTESIFEFYPPLAPPIGVVSIPHSGEVIPKEFSELLIGDFDVLSRDVDTGVHKLINIEELNKAGVAVLKANIHRACVDLNRSPDVCVLNWKKNSHGEELIRKLPDPDTENLLSKKYHAPYYEMIKALINELYKQMERPSFIDLHSMPSKPTKYHLDINPNQALERPDFCVSDIEGKSCEKEFIDFVSSELAKDYEKVNQNDPYFGGHVTRHVDATFPNVNNIQIEISRATYLNEENRTIDKDLADKLRPILTRSLVNTFEKFSSR